MTLLETARLQNGPRAIHPKAVSMDLLKISGTDCLENAYINLLKVSRNTELMLVQLKKSVREEVVMTWLHDDVIKWNHPTRYWLAFVQVTEQMIEITIETLVIWDTIIPIMT